MGRGTIWEACKYISVHKKSGNCQITWKIHIGLKNRKYMLNIFYRSYSLISKLTLYPNPLEIRGGGDPILKSWLRTPFFHCRFGFYGKNYIIFVINIFSDHCTWRCSEAKCSQISFLSRKFYLSSDFKIIKIETKQKNAASFSALWVRRRLKLKF